MRPFRSAIVQDWLAHTDSNSKRLGSAAQAQKERPCLNEGPSLSLTEAFDLIAEGSDSVTSSESESVRTGQNGVRAGENSAAKRGGERIPGSSRKRRRVQHDGLTSSESSEGGVGCRKSPVVIDLAEDGEEQRVFRLSKLSPEAQDRLGRCKDICIKGLTKFHGDIVLLVSFDEGFTDLVLAKDAKRLFPDAYFEYLESLLVFERAKGV